MKMIKKLALLLCIVMVLCSFTIASFAETEGEATIVIEADKANPQPGDTIEFTVSLVNADKMDGGVWNVEFTLDMPEGLTFVEGSAVVDTTTFTGAFFNANMKWGSFGRMGSGYTGEKLTLVTFKCTLADDFAGDLVLTTVENTDEEVGLMLTDKDGNGVYPTAPEYKLHICAPVDVPEVPAKCEENGTEAHQKCSCGKLYQNGVEVTEADLVIEKLNHKNAESEWDFEPYTDGNYDIVTYCPDCETELERIKPGVAENPFLVTFVMGDDGLSMTATVEVPAGEFYCRGGMMIAGKTLTVTDTAGNVISTETLQPPRMPGDPVVFVLTNEGSDAVKYNLTVTTPLGAMDNPAELVIGDNEFAVEAGNDQGYYLTWTAPAAGYLRLFATVSPDGVVYAMNATNFMTYKQYTLDEDAVDGVLLLPVAEGDEIMINVAALEDAQGNRYPAAEFAVTALFTGDSEENPEWIYNVEFDDEYTVGTYTMEVPVGTVHIATYNVGGMILTVTDAEGNVVNQQLLPSAVGRTPVGFTLTNEGEATATYTLTFTYPVGSFMNPDELVEGDNSAEFEKDAQEPYYFEWVAPEDGTVTVIVTADGGWVFAVGNITTSVYSEEYCSADDPVVNTVTMEVKKGDVIMVAVVSVDPQDPNTIVAGTVNVNFEFTSAPAKTGDPITMVLAAALISGMSVVALTKKKEN